MKIIKPIISAVLFLFTISILSTVWNLDNSGAFDTVATFLSITIGFTITALSIIATSSFSKELYKTEDEKDNSKTLLHVLINLFKTSTFIFILTIGLILVYKFIKVSNLVEPSCSIKSYEITLSVLLKAVIWYLTMVSFYFFIKLFNTFSKFVIKTATRQ